MLHSGSESASSKLRNPKIDHFGPLYPAILMRISLKKMTTSATSRSEARSSELRNRRVDHLGPSFRACSMRVCFKIIGISWHRRTSTPKIVTLEARFRPQEGSKKGYFSTPKKTLQNRYCRVEKPDWSAGRSTAKILVNRIIPPDTRPRSEHVPKLRNVKQS